jgi:hypothetical protein
VTLPPPQVSVALQRKVPAVDAQNGKSMVGSGLRDNVSMRDLCVETNVFNLFLLSSAF